MALQDDLDLVVQGLADHSYDGNTCPSCDGHEALERIEAYINRLEKEIFEAEDAKQTVRVQDAIIQKQKLELLTIEKILDYHLCADWGDTQGRCQICRWKGY